MPPDASDFEEDSPWLGKKPQQSSLCLSFPENGDLKLAKALSLSTNKMQKPAAAKDTTSVLLGEELERELEVRAAIVIEKSLANDPGDPHKSHESQPPSLYY